MILAGLLPLATFVFGQGPRVALKSGVGGWIMGHTALEGELRIQERMSIGLRLGGIYGQVQTEGPGRGMKPPLFTGFFIKAGPKFYLSPERAFGMGGFAIQGQAVFSYWHDWGYQGFGGPMGWRWEYGMGALAQFSYGLKLWDRVVIEPQAAIGWISTFDRSKGVGDQPPFDEFTTRLYRLDLDEIRGGRHSHLPLKSGFSVSAGIMLGVTL